MTQSTNMPKPGGRCPTVPRPGEFEYVFPAIRGVQAGREYYVTMWPLRLIPKLFLFDEEELPPQMRAQRSLNKARVPEMARYMVENPSSYIFSALTASVNAEVHFRPMTSQGGVTGRVGTLTIPMEARFVINDGQHRRAAIGKALEENPDLGDETIAIVMFIDVGLNRCQQMFADLNRYAIRPSTSLNVLYDQRDPLSTVTRSAVMRSPLLGDLTEMETSNLATRSRKLFTLSAFHAANRMLFDGIEPDVQQRTELAIEYWHAVAEQFPSWSQVHRGEVSAGEVRTDFIHTYSIVLSALGRVGNSLLRTSRKRSDWTPYLVRLRELDWRRSNAAMWEGRATVGGRMSKGAANVLLTAAAVRRVLGLALPPEEERAEMALNEGEK